MENEDIKYDGQATIVINESDTSWLEYAKPKVMSAQDISTALRSIKKTSQELMDIKRKIEHVKEYLLEAYDDLGEHAQEVADWLDIELTKDVSVTVTVEFEVQLSVKPGEDLDNILMDLEYSVENSDEVIEYYTGDVTWKES
jgi:ribosome biogenesis SPOUT family RNA methylase Rps3